MTKKKSKLLRRQVYLPEQDWDVATKLGKSINENASYMVRKWVREGVIRDKGAL
jgi:hypothetical protein